MTKTRPKLKFQFPAFVMTGFITAQNNADLIKKPKVLMNTAPTKETLTAYESSNTSFNIGRNPGSIRISHVGYASFYFSCKDRLGHETTNFVTLLYCHRNVTFSMLCVFSKVQTHGNNTRFDLFPCWDVQWRSLVAATIFAVLQSCSSLWCELWSHHHFSHITIECCHNNVIIQPTLGVYSK